MATTDEERLRRELSTERDELAEAVETLRAEIGEATKIGERLKAKLPIATVGALGLGFVAAGGVGATMRLVFRRGREGHEKARAGRFSLVRR
jgi:hypothetical protein